MPPEDEVTWDADPGRRWRADSAAEARTRRGAEGGLRYPAGFRERLGKHCTFRLINGVWHVATWARRTAPPSTAHA